MEIYEECFGRTYYFRCEDQEACAEWVLAMRQGEFPCAKVIPSHERILLDFHSQPWQMPKRFTGAV